MDPTADIKRILEAVKKGIILSSADERLLKQHKNNLLWRPSLKDVAAHMGVTDTALQRWKHIDPEAFEKSELGYDLDRIKAARKQFQATSPQTRLADGDEINLEGVQDVATLKARKIDLECQKLLLDIERKRGQLIPIDEALLQFRTILYAVREEMKRMPAELAYEVSGVSPAEAEDRINECLDKTLQRISDTNFAQLEVQLRQQSGQDDVPAAAPEEDE